MNDTLNEKFNITETVQTLPAIIIDRHSLAEADFNNAREKMLDILIVGKNAINVLGDLAIQSQDPDMFLALSKLLKEMSGAASNLLKLHEQSNQLHSNTTDIRKQEFHNHLHFEGSTNDLSNALRALKNQ